MQLQGGVDYELTVSVAKQALHGWQLFLTKNYAGDFNQGHYTDTQAATQLKDFWSDGRYAMVDRDRNGHHETIFWIQDQELVYVGSLGMDGKFVNTARSSRSYLGESLASFVDALPE